MTAYTSSKLASGDSTSVYAYHLLRCAIDKYQKSLHELNEAQHHDVARRAEKSYTLESLVLSSDEARDIVIDEKTINHALNEIASRYDDDLSFDQDLARNQLNKSALWQALQRELIFNAVMEQVASKSATTSDLDVRLFYELHRERFTSPETRTASHILITINPEYEENTREESFSRISNISEKLKSNPNRFISLAKRYSECPTAMDDGSLGIVQRGVLYPELDAKLFSMKQGEISDVVESEIGFHLLYCKKIHKAKALPLSRVYDKIRESLNERKRRTCQKAWIKQLQKGGKHG